MKKVIASSNFSKYLSLKNTITWIHRSKIKTLQYFLINKFITIRFINPFHATGLFRKPLKTSENLWFSDVFKGYQKRPVAWNGLITRVWDCFVVISWMKMGSILRVITLSNALHDLVPFAQFKKREKYPWKSVNTLTKSNFSPRVFYMFFKLYKSY